MKLPKFEYLEPKELGEALELLKKYKNDIKILAGGTDLLVRMKQRLVIPKFILNISKIDSLDFIREDEEGIHIGAMALLFSIYKSPSIKEKYPALTYAAKRVGAPTIQHYKGTIGGNILQDTRCLFYNQSHFWRSGRQACHKAGGKTCYAVDGSDRCWSTYQSDLAPVLLAMNSKVVIESIDSKRLISLEELFTQKGEEPFDIRPDELLTEFIIPHPSPLSFTGYKRLSYRSAIDYPIVSAALFLELNNKEIEKIRLVIGAIARGPLSILGLSKIAIGKKIEDGIIKKIQKRARDQAEAFAAPNVGSEVDYRIEMVSTLVYKLFKDAINYFDKRG